MGVVHLPHPPCGMRFLLHRLKEVDELLTCCTRDHGHSLPWETRCRHFLDEIHQEHTVLHPLTEKEGLDKSRGAEGRSKDGDAVFIWPLPVAVGIRLVRQSAAVWDRVHLEGEGRISGGGLQELTPPIARGWLNEDPILLRMGRETGLLSHHLREGLHDFPDDLRGAQNRQVVRYCE